MTTIQKISGFGGAVIGGDPQDGDIVRITSPNGIIEERFTVQAPPIPKAAHFDKAAFSDWFTATFGADGKPTLAEIKVAWPNQ